MAASVDNSLPYLSTVWGTVCCSLFFCSKFCSSIPNGRCGEKIFNVACYVTYGRMACGTLSISKDGKVEK